MSEVEQVVELSAHEQQAAEYEMTLWRQRGAFGKLHNVIKHIKASPQRQQQFKRIIKSVLIKRGENGGGSSHNDGGDGSEVDSGKFGIVLSNLVTNPII